MRTAITLLAAVAVLGLTRCAPGGDPPADQDGMSPTVAEEISLVRAGPRGRRHVGRPRENQGLDASRYQIVTPTPFLSRAVAVGVGEKEYAVAVQIRSPSACPGIRPTRSCSFRKKAKSCGPFRCETNSRYGTVDSAILPRPRADGARVVLFFAGNYPPGEQPSHFHSWHMITFGDRSWSFHMRNWVPDNLDIWNRQGLCRLGIADNKLVVLFPKLEMPDLAKTRS